MWKKAVLCGVAAFVLAGPVPSAVPASYFGLGVEKAFADESISIFFDDLAPYGSWVQRGDIYVWVPANVGPSWSPYVNGHWVYTDEYGWYFESDEVFAPIAYHYGRWGYDDQMGWYWVPGTEWGPAWVTWRRGDDEVGWAPLPPDGDRYVDYDEEAPSDLPPGYWRFVRADRFLEPTLSIDITFGDRDPDAFRRTQFVGSARRQHNIFVNNVINLNFIEQVTKHKVEVHKIQTVGDPKLAVPGGPVIKAFVGTITPPSKTLKPTKIVAPQQAKLDQAKGGKLGTATAVGINNPGTGKTGTGVAATGTGALDCTGAKAKTPACLKANATTGGSIPSTTGGTTGVTGATGAPKGKSQVVLGDHKTLGSTPATGALAPCTPAEIKIHAKNCTVTGNPTPGSNAKVIVTDTKTGAKGPTAGGTVSSSGGGNNGPKGPTGPGTGPQNDKGTASVTAGSGLKHCTAAEFKAHPKTCLPPNT